MQYLLAVAVIAASYLLYATRARLAEARVRCEALEAELTSGAASAVAAGADVEEAKRAVAAAEVEAELQRRRADEYLSLIEGVVEEANAARQLYQRMAAQHGNAQGMMMTEISSLGRQYLALASEYTKAVGKPPPRPEPRMNQSIQRVAADFEGQHIGRVLPMPKTEKAADGTATAPVGA